MATKDLSQYDIESVPSAQNMRFGIVVAEWNLEITANLARGAVDTLKKHGATDDNILVKFVPGSFELPLGASILPNMKT
jgi:6,7-dimethyl-8-ribityllumazine synthase